MESGDPGAPVIKVVRLVEKASEKENVTIHPQRMVEMTVWEKMKKIVKLQNALLMECGKLGAHAARHVELASKQENVNHQGMEEMTVWEKMNRIAL